MRRAQSTSQAAVATAAAATTALSVTTASCVSAATLSTKAVAAAAAPDKYAAARGYDPPVLRTGVRRGLLTRSDPRGSSAFSSTAGAFASVAKSCTSHTPPASFLLPPPIHSPTHPPTHFPPPPVTSRQLTRHTLHRHMHAGVIVGGACCKVASASNFLEVRRTALRIGPTVIAESVCLHRVCCSPFGPKIGLFWPTPSAYYTQHNPSLPRAICCHFRAARDCSRQRLQLPETSG